MNVNKKFDRFKQWAGEKMGGEARTNTSDDFKRMEMEMEIRHDGTRKLQESMSIYVKHEGKKAEIGERDKLPIGYLGSSMISHGQDFSPDSEYGNCLSQFGRVQESIARRQEAYVTNSTSSWSESLERSLAQLKEYQFARKKLETRRLAYDTSLTKIQKAKKEDFKSEEELRAQKAKYEESSEDVWRRMEDIKESEKDSIADLTQFLEAELSYHESCRNLLLDLKRGWPGNSSNGSRTPMRSRSNTAQSYNQKFSSPTPTSPIDEIPPPAPPRPNVVIPKSMRSESMNRGDMPILSRTESIRQEAISSRPESPTSGRVSPSQNETPTSGMYNRTPVRIPRSGDASPTSFRYTETFASSTHSPVLGSGGNILIGGGNKKAPPPPPPRAKKPAPPPPMKRSSYSSPEVPTSAQY